MHYLNFRHLGLVTKDLDNCLDIFINVLGLKIIKKTTENQKFIEKILKVKKCNLTTYKIGKGGKIFLEILDFNKKIKQKKYLLDHQGLTHFALTVKNLNTLIAKLKKKKVIFLSRPVMSIDKKYRVLFCKTIDNIFLELVEKK
ncbi:VOC family protein [Candidatus Pelagibacter sp. HIMB1517]|uniref:VOC family protein n=1 Tax=Candidatus Pelagibacter sp. HIMB1517 TaxID=3413341 RepID=UPI003F84BCE1